MDVTKPHFNRREFMAVLMAGGVVTVAGLWLPGEKLISIPSHRYFVPAGQLAWMEGEQTVFYGGALRSGKSELIRLSPHFKDLVQGAQLVRQLERV